MAFQDSFDKTQEEIGGDTDFFKFTKDGSYKFRVMSEPAVKASRFGFGVVYKGATWATKVALDADYKKLQEKAVAEGKDPTKVKQPNISIKWEMWAINRANGKLVILDLTNKLVKKLRNFMDSDEYKFVGFPMPYDITVSVTNAGTIEAEYDLLPARKEVPITPEETEAFEKVTPITQIIERMKAKQREKDGVPAPVETEGETPVIQTAPAEGGVKYPDEEINPEDIPF